MKKPYFSVSIELVETDIDIITTSGGSDGADFYADELWGGNA